VIRYLVKTKSRNLGYKVGLKQYLNFYPQPLRRMVEK
jgi:hypothetical protein